MEQFKEPDNWLVVDGLNINLSALSEERLDEVCNRIIALQVALDNDMRVVGREYDSRERMEVFTITYHKDQE